MVTTAERDRADAFNAWFSGSRVVGEDGAPKVMYHGTSVWELPDGRQLGDVTEFDRMWATKVLRRKPGIDTVGSWFSDNPGKDGAGMYASHAIYPVHLSIKRPWTVTFEGMQRTANRLLGRPREGKLDGVAVERLRQWMEEVGFDGINVQHDEWSSNRSTEFKNQDAWIALHPHQIKSAVGNVGAYDPNNADIRYSLSEPAAFFSQLERVLEELPDRMAINSGPQWTAWLDANAAKFGIKKDEIEWSGIKEYLDLRGKEKVSRDELVSFLAENGVQVAETVLGGNASYTEWMAKKYGVPASDAEDLPEYDDDSVHAEFIAQTGRVKYDDYVVPGGDNYREVLITLPSKGNSPQYNTRHWDGVPNILAHLRVDDRTDDDGKRVLFIHELQSDWGQGGKKMGFRDATKPWELFDPKNAAEIVDRFATKDEAAAAAVKAEKDGGVFLDYEDSREKPPLAPFVTDTKAWVGLALKRAIMMAVDGGYDRVAMITGQQASDLYDLSRRVDRIEYAPADGEKFDLVVHGKDGREAVNEDGIDIERIEALVGKDIAAKIAAGDGASNKPKGWGVFDESDALIFDSRNEQDAVEYAKVYAGESTVKIIGGGYDKWRTLSDIDLQVGGAGMVVFYDKLVPQIARDVLRKIGGSSLQTVNVGESNGGMFVIQQPNGSLYSQAGGIAKFESKSRAQAVINKLSRVYGVGYTVSDAPNVGGVQPGFEITPEMRASVQNGVALFSHAAVAQSQPRATPESVRAAIAQLVRVGPEDLVEGVGHIVVATSDQLPASALATEQNEAFKAWFGKSKVVDGQGNPAVRYHGTVHDFSTFEKTKDIGFHFGNVEQAHARFGRMRNGRNMVPAYLSIQNPVRLLEDPFSWMPSYVIDCALPEGVLDADEKNRLLAESQAAIDAAQAEAKIAREKSPLAEISGAKRLTDKEWDVILYRHTSKVLASLRSVLEAKGYDGMVYVNKYEGKRSAKVDSWVAFNSQQIKSSTGNFGTYDKSSPDIRYSAPAVGPRAQAWHDGRTNTTVFLADRIPAGREASVFLHETIHRHGRQALPEGRWSALVGQVKTWAQVGLTSPERAIHDAAAARVATAGVVGALADEELFAYAVEEAVAMGIEPTAAAVQGSAAAWLQAVVESIQRVTDKLIGNDLQQLGGQDLVDLAYALAQLDSPVHGFEVGRAIGRAMESQHDLEIRSRSVDAQAPGF